MSEKSYFSQFALYCSLNVLGMLALSCYILADTFFVANGLGTDGLAALNLAIPVYSFIHGAGLMLGMGGATRYALLLHQGRAREAGAAFTHAAALTAALALLFFCLGLLYSGPITALLGANQAVAPMCRTYLRVLLLFSPAFLLNDLLICFVRNDGAPQRAMAAMVSGSLSNIVLDYLFIFPLGMGILGAVLATGLAPIISLAVLSPHLLQGKNSFRLGRCAPSLGTAGHIAGLGAPSLAGEVSSGLVIVLFNQIMLGLQGNLGVAAYGVVANLSLVVMAVFTGVAQGVQPLLSRGFATENRLQVRVTLRYAVLTALIFSAGLYLLVFLGAEPIAALFNRDGDGALQAIAARGLRLYFTAAPWAGLNIVLAVYFTSTGRSRPAQLIALLRGFLLILPLAFLLSALWGMDGLWLALPIAEGAVAGLAAALYFLGRGSSPNG